MADQQPTREQMIAELQAHEASQAPAQSLPTRAQMIAELQAHEAQPSKGFLGEVANEASNAVNSFPSKTAQIGTNLNNVLGGVNAGVNSFANMATGNYAPQIAGGMGVAGGLARDAFNLNPPDAESIESDYTSARDKARAVQQKGAADYPVPSALGGVAGAALSPLNKLMPAAEGAGALGRLAQAGRNGLTYGLLANPDDQNATDPLQLADRIRNANYGAGIGVAAQGLLGEPIRGTKKLISTFLGPSEESIDAYLRNPEAIKTAPNVATMKNMIDDQIRGLNEKVSLGQMRVDQAQDHLDSLNENLKQVARDAGKEYQSALPQLQQSVQDARAQIGGLDAQIGTAQDQAATAYQQQQAQAKAQLQAVPHPREMADDVHQAVGDLKQQVVAGSAQARQIAANSGLTVQTAPVAKVLTDAIDNLKINGKLPATSQGQTAVAQLQALADGIKGYGPSLSGEDAKKLIQQLDAAVEYTSEAGGFGEAHDKALIEARRAVDAQLKAHQPYADQMAMVSNKTALLHDANNLFGTRQRAFSQMNGIANAGKTPQQDVLNALGAHTGHDFSTPIGDYQAAQNTLKNGFGQNAPQSKSDFVENALQQSGLPAQRPNLVDAAKAGDDIQSIAPHLKDSYVQGEVAESGLPGKISAREAQLQKLQQDLDEANARSGRFSKWGKYATQDKLQGLISKNPDRASIEAGRELQELDYMRSPEDRYNGPSYPEMIDANRVRNDFSRNQTRGSRNALIWRGVGGAVGAGVGTVFPGFLHYPVVLGGAAGGLVGGYIDKNGGPMAQGMLDEYLKNPGLYNAIGRTNINRVMAPWIMMKSQTGGNQ